MAWLQQVLTTWLAPDSDGMLGGLVGYKYINVALEESM